MGNSRQQCLIILITIKTNDYTTVYIRAKTQGREIQIPSYTKSILPKEDYTVKVGNVQRHA